MDLQEQITRWAEKMGYQHKMPDNLKQFSNASTAGVWAQIIEKVKPRQEIEHVRKNLVLHSLQSDADLKRTKVRLDFPIDEVDVYFKKQELEKDLAKKQIEFQEKERGLEKLSQQNKCLYLKIESAQKSIEECQQKTFLYENYVEDLVKKIEEVGNKLIQWRNLTPVEGEIVANRDVTEDLKQCCLKLEKLSLKNFENDASRQVFNTPKSGKKIGSFLYSKSASKVFHLDEEFNNRTMIENQLDLEAVKKNQSFIDSTETMLCKYNRKLIWNTLRGLQDDVKYELKNFVDTSENTHNRANATTQGKMSEMHTIHIKKEFEAIKCSLTAQILKRKIQKRLDQIFSSLRSETMNDVLLEEVKTSITLKMEELSLNSTLASFNASIVDLRGVGNNENDLIYVQESIHKLQTISEANVNNLMYKLRLFEYLKKAMDRSKTDTYLQVKKLHRFTENIAWMQPLDEEAIVDEMKTFASFPLHYNKQFKFTNNSKNAVLFNDVSNRVPFDEDLDSNSVSMVIAILDNPALIPDTIIFNFLRNKMRLKALSKFNKLELVYNNNIYTYEQLQKQENYIDYAIDKFWYLVGPCDKKTSLSIPRMEELMKLWVEMPVKDYISSSRLFNGEKYKYYENMYDSFYNQL